MRRLLMLLAGALFFNTAFANDYRIDPTHTFVEWRVQHLGYSWLYGRFNTMGGTFYWDQDNPSKAAITVEIDVTSIDSNHAERDKHLRDEKYLNVKKFPTATFKSTTYDGNADGGKLAGVLTLHGVSKAITFDIARLGQGKDPWGGYRAGFIAKAVIDRRDFGIDADLGPMANTVELELGIEGILDAPSTAKH